MGIARLLKMGRTGSCWGTFTQMATVWQDSPCQEAAQPALSKQLTELEEQYGLHLFNREKGRLIELTESGQIFVEEASAALSHAERAIQLARATQEGSDRILTVGHSPHCDQSWISTVLTIRLPLYPKLRVRL